MKNNAFFYQSHWLYLAGFFVILALPLLLWQPWFFPPDFGKTVIFRIILTILCVGLAFQWPQNLARFNSLHLKKAYTAWFLAILLGAYGLATLFSVDPQTSLWSSPYRGGGFVTFAGYIVVAMVAYLTLTRQEWEKLWDFSILIGALISLVAISQYYGIFGAPQSRPTGTMGNAILLAVYLLLLVFMIAVRFLKEPCRTKKIFYGVCGAVCLLAILLSGTRAAYLGIGVGATYFLIWYPITEQAGFKKIRIFKRAAVILLLIAIAGIAYINLAPLPRFLQQNRLFTTLTPRFMVKNLLEDTRLSTLGIELKAVKAKPFLGYGPENFSVGFDHYYQPSPSLEGILSWWDRAHNIFIQTMNDAGILGLLAYLGLIAALFWQLSKVKTLTAHGSKATLLAYLVANLFSFDSFSSYLLFFFLAGYSLHLALLTPTQEAPPLIPKKKIWKTAMAIGLAGLAAVFIWQYNLVPLSLNAEINTAQALVNQGNCGQGIAVLEKALVQHSFLDSYARLQYVEMAKTCAEFYPQNTLFYKQRGLELIKQAVVIQPTYTRYWIFMGNAANELANQEQNSSKKNELIKQAYQYLDQALTLAPGHQEILAQYIQIAMTAKEFALAHRYAQTCINANPKLGDCHFYLGLTQIYEKDIPGAKINIDIAHQKGTDITSEVNLLQLANAYGSLMDYRELLPIYQKLAGIRPEVAQYHSSLAFFYGQAGNYYEARQEALIVLKLSPESKSNVEAFLKTLPN